MIALFSLAAIVASAHAQTIVFSFTGSPQTFVVPSGAFAVDIVAAGAQGGLSIQPDVNFGGVAVGRLAVTPGETLHVFVGGQPALGSTTGGFNGGGNGDNSGTGGAAGGGASDVRQGGTALTDRVIVAGGGGGGGGVFSGLNIVGGVGGGLAGGNGFRVPTDPGGLGGTQVSGGSGTCINFNVAAVGGSLGQGGTPLGQNCGCQGYGGGGGFFGGSGSGNCRGGGGGSGFLSPGLSNAAFQTSNQAGNGQVTLTVLTSTTVGGDPHVKGMFDIDLEVFGKSGANYSLVVGPAFEVNMQLANRGPEERFMTHLAVLYRGTSIAIGPWDLKTRKAALIKHFEALGSRVVYEGEWRVTIELCAQHKITLTTHHTANKLALNYLDLEFSVPGCHDAYGGLLGQTYQCRWATENFQWSRDKEDAFLVPSLTTPSGSYSATAACADEDEYHGMPANGGIAHSSDGAKMTLLKSR